MIASIQAAQAGVIVVLFAGVTVLGLFAGRWRKADLRQIDEWALGGRRFGGFLTWFLQGGSVYTTYSFIAIPAVAFGTGVAGFYALPFLVIAYPVAFIFSAAAFVGGISEWLKYLPKPSTAALTMPPA